MAAQQNCAMSGPVDISARRQRQFGIYPQAQQESLEWAQSMRIVQKIMLFA